MTLYCGIDLHANNSVVAVLDEADRTIFEKRLPNDLQTIITVLQPYQAVLSGCVVESTYNWYWLVDGLMDAGFQVHLAHTRKRGRRHFSREKGDGGIFPGKTPLIIL